MADEEQQDQDAPPKKGGILKLLLIGVFGLLCAAGGFAVPMLFPQLASTAESPQSEPEPPKPDFITFDQLSVNLNEGRMNRYLRFVMTIQIDEEDGEFVKPLVEDKKSILRNWLVNYVSDLKIEDIRGAAGQNRLRREIQDNFNTILFTDGYDRIRDVLFEEFNIQ